MSDNLGDKLVDKLADTRCATCVRLIVSSNKLWANGPLLRDNKAWCGGCSETTRYISYPAVTEYFDACGTNRMVFRKKPEAVPSKAPWTTWSGLVLCAEDSDEGRALMQMDPNYEPGYVYVDKDRKELRPGTVRGLYTA